MSNVTEWRQRVVAASLRLLASEYADPNAYSDAEAEYAADLIDEAAEELTKARKAAT